MMSGATVVASQLWSVRQLGQSAPDLGFRVRTSELSGGCTMIKVTHLGHRLLQAPSQVVLLQ